MRLLADQDVYAATIRLLREWGHDAVTAAELGLSQAVDTELLRIAQAQGRIFVTRDRDFGNLVFVQRLGTGVVYIRMTPATQSAVHLELQHVLVRYSEADLRSAFVVVEAGRHRLRRPRRDNGGTSST